MNRDTITDKHLAAAASIQPDYWFYMPDEEDWPKKWEEDDGTYLKRILGNYSWKKVVAHFETTEVLAHAKSAENVAGGEQASKVNELPADSEHSGPASEDVEAADRGDQNMTVTRSPDTTNASGGDDGRANRIHGGRWDIEYPTIRTADHGADNGAIAKDKLYSFNASAVSVSKQPPTSGLAPQGSAKFNTIRWIRDSFGPELPTSGFATQEPRNEYPYPQSLVPEPLSINKLPSTWQASQTNTQTATDTQENSEHPSKNPRTRRRFMRWWSSLTKERRSHILQDLVSK
ncbi:hypothetical protein CGLO_08302 [Colletotrichum gloeosporioides Cg-14]|uniref:Uncharacterized protein n=1 Tax=Colletotrichum gloeosporioides (strain Cg-14) TaxID=1237896 RepID=T0K960_COLGC|nr:hypothetical protein CGLO_08302 [Colletotrichum gloeosporioides Cg-14]